MKSYTFYTLLILGSLFMFSCGTSKKMEQTPIATFVMPCSEFVSGNGVLRAWASGKSDNKTVARKKAQTAAATELAAMLERTVKATTEEYTTNLSEGEEGNSKALLNEKSMITIEQTLRGVSIVCDRWETDKATGQYTNYLVLELRGEEYLKALYEILDKEKVTSVDKELLKELFFKHIGNTKK